MALYNKAADILDKVEQKRGAVKTLVYDSKFQVCSRKPLEAVQGFNLL